MADAYSRIGKTREEFAIYDSVLQELAVKADKMPLGARTSQADYDSPAGNRLEEGEESEGEDSPSGVIARPSGAQRNSAFEVSAASTLSQTGARSPEYARVLERYMARLGEVKEIPAALGGLRRELDDNPDDPGLYERLAGFLGPNRLRGEQDAS